MYLYILDECVLDVLFLLSFFVCCWLDRCVHDRALGCFQKHHGGQGASFEGGSSSGFKAEICCLEISELGQMREMINLETHLPKPYCCMVSIF